MDVKEIGSEGVEWLDLAQDKENWRCFVNTVLKI